VLTSAQANVASLQTQAAQPSLDRAALREGLGKVADRLAYLERFVDDMATYSREVSAERVTVRLADVVSEAHSLVADAIRSAHSLPTGIGETISVDDRIAVMVARHQIIAALVNVLKNAYEAVLHRADEGQPGCVALTANCTGDEVRIVIQDNGVGMNADDLRAVRAFVPGRTTKKGSGTGFGLPIAQRYIAAHGGSISIDSADNVGTTVNIVLPIESRQEPEE
jgi:signal transduction histidine kinase